MKFVNRRLIKILMSHFLMYFFFFNYSMKNNLTSQLKQNRNYNTKMTKIQINITK